MTVYRLQNSLQCDSGLPRDQFVNTLHVESTAATSGNINNWIDAVVAFYEALRTINSPVVAKNGHTVRVYQVGLPLDSPPVGSRTYNFTTAPTGTGMPNEVACCLSFKGAAHPGWERQSTYGRMYLGPFNSTASSIDGPSGYVTVGSGIRDSIVTLATAMAGAFNTANGKWIVYSKLHTTGTPVNTCFVNDEWDTVRSRGFRESARTTGIIVQP